jgi:hypothetical protein
MTTDIKPIERSMDGIRDTLFEELELLRAGKIEHKRAATTSSVCITIIKSVEVQMKFESMKLDSKLPSRLPGMPLLPALKRA